MKEVFSQFNDIDPQTLVIFDVDMVLVQPSEPAFQMANMKRFSAITKRIMKEIPHDKLMLFLSLMTVSSDPVLIDHQTPQFLQQLIQRDIPIIALTANLTGPLGKIAKMENWRIEELRKVGIDFSKTAPYPSPIIFDNLASYRGNYSTYLDGVLFVNGANVSKGQAFLSFLRKTDYYPRKVIFVDDREDNLKSLEMAIQELDKKIEYQGFHYLEVQNYPSKAIAEEEFEYRWQQLAHQLKGVN